MTKRKLDNEIDTIKVTKKPKMVKRPSNEVLNENTKRTKLNETSTSFIEKINIFPGTVLDVKEDSLITKQKTKDGKYQLFLDNYPVRKINGVCKLSIIYYTKIQNTYKHK